MHVKPIVTQSLLGVEIRREGMVTAQVDVLIGRQCVWDNPKSTPAIIGNYSRDHGSVVGSMCLCRGQFGFWSSPGLLLTNTRPSLVPKQNLLSSENTTDLHSVLLQALT
ncbi:hypothetical protein TNCV_2200351 [Trichonephila clavipes]|nr:hypothetical protein TNCV_2200351 [Trichonephila clavipes]